MNIAKAFNEANITEGVGYWMPHTSSIDFCEPNYSHSFNIVELHNVWSSILGLSAVGLFGILHGNPTNEWRFTFVYLTLIAIGIGSAFLHGTLHWIFQSSDELPMIYLIICMSFAVLECESPKGEPKYPFLPLTLVVLGAVNTIVYYIFQQFYFIFFLTFTSFSIVATAGLARLVFFSDKPRCNAKRLFLLGEMWFSLIGFPLWALDMMLCHNYVLPVSESMPGYFLVGITPHIVWHIAAGLGAYTLTLSCCCCRLDTLKVPYRVGSVLGGLLQIIHVAKETTAVEGDKKEE